MAVNNSCKTRFAPSPTGSLHIGGARTALFNWLWAKHNDGDFFLRFEDTDRARSFDIYKEQIKKDLEWLGLTWNENVVSQSQRLERYNEVREDLYREGKIYPCFCSQNTLIRCGCPAINSSDKEERMKHESHCWRLFVDSNQSTTFQDALHGEVTISHDNFGDIVLFRSDGWPTYLFTVVVDDHDMEITDVIRGEEHLSNVPKQLLVYEALAWTPPRWAHIPMILDCDRQKLSKRKGAMGIAEYRDAGWQPEAILAYLATLSWSYAPADRILFPEELAALFNLTHVALAAPVHDEGRLRHFGKMAMSHQKNEQDIELLIQNFFPSLSTEAKCELKSEIIPECASFSDFEQELQSLLNAPIIQEFEGEKPSWFDDIFASFGEIQESDWNSENIKSLFKAIMKKKDVKGFQFYHPLRLALSGKEKGIPLPLLCAVIGKQESLARLKRFL